MELKEFDILLDIKKPKKTEEIEVVQKDLNSNVLNISIVENLIPYSLYDLDVEIAFAKPDGTTVIQDEDNGVTVAHELGGKIRCILNTNTIAAAGKALAEVRILKDEKILTTARFYFYIRKAIINDDTVESTNEYPVLNQKIEEVNNLIEYVQGMEAIKGDDGRSAYEVWLDNGNTGTVEEYLNSLIGPEGKEGPEGKQGPEGKEGPEGKQGIQGEKGAAGTSLKILGSYNTLQELENAYPNGSSLDGGFMIGIEYYYWGSNGWTSAGPLQGPEGKEGPEGKQGPEGKEGPEGKQGEPGEDGKDGSDANVTSENIIGALNYTPADETDLKKLEYSELSSTATNIDNEDIYKNTDWKRRDNTLYAKSSLLGTYPYSQIKIDYYDDAGTNIIKSITWNLTYDNNDFPYKREVV